MPGAAQGHGGVPSKNRAAPARQRQQGRLAGNQGAGAAHAQGNQQGIRTGASQRNLQAMRATHPCASTKAFCAPIATIKPALTANPLKNTALCMSIPVRLCRKPDGLSLRAGINSVKLFVFIIIKNLTMLDAKPWTR